MVCVELTKESAIPGTSIKGKLSEDGAPETIEGEADRSQGLPDCQTVRDSGAAPPCHPVTLAVKATSFDFQQNTIASAILWGEYTAGC